MSGRDPNVADVASDDARMKTAMTEAKATAGDFIEALRNRSPGASGFAVKIPLQAGSHTEHVWVNRVSFDGKLFHGVVNNEPTIATGVKIGDRVTARPDEISDWMYVRNRRLVGGRTIRAVRAGLSAEGRAEFDRTAPFVVESDDGNHPTDGAAPK
jgi:uncharacterized protein YegJ (DUF2314 family)